MLLYPTGYNAVSAPPQQPQDQIGAWGAGPSAVGQPMPTQWGAPNAAGVTPGWESLYAGGQVSTPTPSPMGQAPMQQPNTAQGLSFGGSNAGQAVMPTAPAPMFTSPGSTSGSKPFGAGGMQPGMAYAGGSNTFNESAASVPFGAGGSWGMPGIANDPSGGGSINSNPYMKQQIDYLKSTMQDALGQNLQGIRSNFVGSGGLGGDRQRVAEENALKNFDQSFGGAAANMLSGNYQFDRGLNTQSYAQHRGLDLSQAGLGMQAMNQGLGAPWQPLQNANSMYSPYTGLGTQSTPGTGGGWQGALGGGLSAAAFARQMGWL